MRRLALSAGAGRSCRERSATNPINNPLVTNPLATCGATTAGRLISSLYRRKSHLPSRASIQLAVSRGPCSSASSPPSRHPIQICRRARLDHSDDKDCQTKRPLQEGVDHLLNADPRHAQNSRARNMWGLQARGRTQTIEKPATRECRRKLRRCPRHSQRRARTKSSPSRTNPLSLQLSPAAHPIPPW